jgi:predicted Fe-S protein YdhL (DUF1289 family)
MARTLSCPRLMNPPSASAVPSPCVGVCRMNGATGWCEGCLRTIDEIALWSQLIDRDRLAVWKALPLRRLELSPPDA